MEENKLEWAKARIRWGKLGALETGWVRTAKALEELVKVVANSPAANDHPLIIIYRAKDGKEWEAIWNGATQTQVSNVQFP